MASKIQVAKFHDFIEGSTLDPISSGVWNMEENEVVGHLSDESFKKRVEILEQLIITVKRNGGRLPYSDHESIFRGLGLALSDSNWEIRLKCILLLQELIPSLQDNLDHCMSLVLSKLIFSIGDSKVTLRKAVISAIHRYMKHTTKLPSLLNAIVNTGLENDDARVRREMITALPVLLTKEYASANLYSIVQSLAKKLLDTSTEDNLKDASLTTLQSIKNLLGEDQFDVYIQKLSPSLRKYYLQLSDELENGFTTDSLDQTGMYSTRSSRIQGLDRRDLYMDSLEFGFIPMHIMTRINDQKDFKTRAQAVEDLKGVVLELTPSDINQKLVPHMTQFMGFLNALLDDSNFKIITVTLEILYSLVERLGSNVKNYVKNIVSVLSKRMGDNKVVIRQSVMRVLMKMMQCYTPQSVLTVIFDNLTHRNSRVRQETINFIIAALLTFPSYEFDLPNICLIVGPTLTDVKRQVRQAALECFAVLAQAMGSGRLQPLVQAVDQVELSSEGEGLMAAVQARLARRQLPKLNGEGLVEYATAVPSSATQRSSSANASADTEWILAVGGASARTARGSDYMELESVTSSARSTLGILEYGAPTPAPRRFMSAGRGRNKLPWEEDERSRAYEEMPTSAPVHGFAEGDGGAPPRPRAMWMGDGDGGSTEFRNTPKRKTTTLESLGLPNEEVDSAGSYSKIYNQKRRLASGPRNSAFAGAGDLPDFTRDAKENGFSKTPRSVLDPISVEPVIKHSDEAYKPDDQSPIPLKATLARGTATHRGNTKVPPISMAPDQSASNDDDTDSAYSFSSTSTPSRTDSLNGIRRSARRKVDNLFSKNNQDTRQSSASGVSEPVEDSGVFTVSGASTRSRRTESTAASEHKPKASSSQKRNSAELDINDNKPTTTFNPNSGVTFHSNRTSDVEVIGKGYSDESSSLFDSTARTNNSNGRPRDRRRSTKGSPLFPLTGSPLASGTPGTLSPEWDKAVEGEERGRGAAQDKMALVGRGMFESPPGVGYPVSTAGISDKGEKRRGEPPRSTAPPGIVGVAVRSTVDMQSSDDSANTNTTEDDSDDDTASLSKSMSFKRKIDEKQRLKKEREEQARQEQERQAEQREREKEERVLQERMRQKNKLKKLSSNESISLESLSVSGSNNSSSTNLNTITAVKPAPVSGLAPKPPAPAVTPRKTIKTASEPVVSNPLPVPANFEHPQEAEEPAVEWKPFPDPENALKAAQKKMENEEWEVKTEGLNMTRRLVHFHASVFSPPILHAIILAVVKEVKNLRSQVSRLAIECFGEMFTYLKKGMDADLDIVARQLLAKAGESNNFIRDELDQTLSAMVDEVTPQRSLLALISGGAAHKNMAVRKITAQFLVKLVERMGSGKILSGVKDVTDRVLPTAAQFSMDQSPETRYYGRKILSLLMSHPDFERMLSKYVPANILRNLQEVIDSLKTKGLGEKPSEISSAKTRNRSGNVGSRMGSSLRGGSANSIDGLGSTTPPVRRRATARTDEVTMDEIKHIINELSASDWRKRLDAINQFQDMCIERPEVVSTHIVKIFDKFLPRLQDSNSKVNLHALKVMQQVIPMLKEALHQVITLAVSAVVPNLSSKNTEIRTTANEILGSFMDHLDHGLLVQPFANQAVSSAGLSKSDMVTKVAYLTSRVYERKPKQVVLHVLPLLWHLLNQPGVGGGSVAGDLRSATSSLVASLYDHMGQGLLDKANSEPSMTARHLNILNELLHNQDS